MYSKADASASQGLVFGGDTTYVHNFHTTTRLRLPCQEILCKLDESAAGWARPNLRSHWSLLIHGLLCFLAPDYDAFAQQGDKHRIVY